MKKIMILAISAILAVNASAQERFAGKQFNKEERVEFDIKKFTNELMLNDQQAEKFAGTYREYAAEQDKLFLKNAPAQFEPGRVLTDAELDAMAKQRFEGFKQLATVQAKFYDKFRKFLSARQVERVMRLQEPFGPDQRPCCAKHNKDGKKHKKAHKQHQQFQERPQLPEPPAQRPE